MSKIKGITHFFAVLLLATAWSWSAHAVTTEDASKFVRSLGQRAIDVLSDKSLDEAHREIGLRKIFLGDFDVDGIARFALGRYWRTATPAERQQYLKVFKEYVVKVYTRAMGQAQNTKFVVTSARPAGTQDDVLVSSEIGEPDRDPIKVDWRVHEANGANKVSDVVVDGVSLVITKRQDFAAVMSQNDGKIAALLDRLREEIAKADQKVEKVE